MKAWVQSTLILLHEACPLDGRGSPRRWVKECEVKTHPPIGTVARRISIVFAADLDTDWLFANFQNLADLKNDRHGPFGVARRVVPIGGRFRAEREGGVRLGRISEER